MILFQKTGFSEIPKIKNKDYCLDEELFGHVMTGFVQKSSGKNYKIRLKSIIEDAESTKKLKWIFDHKNLFDHPFLSKPKGIIFKESQIFLACKWEENVTSVHEKSVEKLDDELLKRKIWNVLKISNTIKYLIKHNIADARNIRKGETFEIARTWPLMSSLYE
jgi:hypothetical protein